jgi:AraC-like DNA-binding protein
MDRRVRVLRDPTGENRWELVSRAPDPRLRALVSRYEGYVEASSVPVLRQQMPVTRVPLIVNFGAPWRIAGSRDDASPSVKESFFAGLYERSVWVEAAGPAQCVQIDLTPIGAYLVFGVPMQELANRVVSLDDILPAGARGLTDRLADTPTWAARFDLLDEALTRRIGEARRPPAPEIVWAFDALERSGGCVRVVALADRIGRSRRHLVARFHEQVGLPPKTVARIFRFQRALQLLREGSGLAALAYECGYFDQAHLSRDFRQFAGVTPGELARRLDPYGAATPG